MIAKEHSNSTWVDNNPYKPLIFPQDNKWFVLWKENSWKFSTLKEAEQFRLFLINSVQ